MSKIKWFIGELIAIYSGKGSYFSKKRIESSIAFIIAEAGIVTYFINNYKIMSVSDLVLWASVNFLIAGYMIHNIEKNKNLNNGKKEE
jgi:hypothetical protein